MGDESAEIGLRLAKLRAALGMKPADICRATGILPPQWTRFESGERRISLDSAIVLKKMYGVTLDWLFLGDASGLPLSLAERLLNPAPPAAGKNHASR